MEIRELLHPGAKEYTDTAAVLAGSFRRAPLFTGFLFRGRRAPAETFLSAMLDYALQTGRVFVAEERGAIVACALWTTPDSPELTVRTVFRLGLWPRFLRLFLQSPAAVLRIAELFHMLETFAPETPCATLEFLASARKGAGAAVLRRSMETFRGVPLYVESIVSKNDHAYYRGFGFTPFARTDFHGTDYAFLLLAPKAGPSA